MLRKFQKYLKFLPRNFSYNEQVLKMSLNSYTKIEMNIPEMEDRCFVLNGIERYFPMFLVPNKKGIEQLKNPNSFADYSNFVSIHPHDFIFIYGILPYLGNKYFKSKFLSVLTQNSKLLNEYTDINEVRLITEPLIDNSEISFRHRFPFICPSKDSKIDLATIRVSSSNTGLVANFGDNGIAPLQENALLRQHTRRPHVLTTAFSACMNLYKKELPFCKSTKNELPGINLFTTVLVNDNHLDQIKISASAAKKLSGYIVKKYQCKTTKVMVNDQILPNGYLGITDDFIVKYNGSVPAIVTKIEKINNSCIIYLELNYKMQDGDKLISRSGYKGVVKIFPDEKMPYIKVADLPKKLLNNMGDLKIQNHRVYFEQVLNPIGILNRANMSTLYELELSLLNEQTNCQKLESKFQNLENTLVPVKGLKTIDQVIAPIGYNFMIRLSKNAIDHVLPNQQQLISLINNSSNTTSNGQKINFTTLLALYFKGFTCKTLTAFSNLYRISRLPILTKGVLYGRKTPD